MRNPKKTGRNLPSTDFRSHYMRRAIALARENSVCPFGAILVNRDADEIVAEGVNRTQENPTWHGEIDVINRYASTHTKPVWSSLDLYTTAEPCPMCQAAILWAGIPRVIYGTSITRLKELGWKQIDISAHEVTRRTSFSQCQIVGGILEFECNQLFSAALEKR